MASGSHVENAMPIEENAHCGGRFRAGGQARALHDAGGIASANPQHHSGPTRCLCLHVELAVAGHGTGYAVSYFTSRSTTLLRTLATPGTRNTLLCRNWS